MSILDDTKSIPKSESKGEFEMNQPNVLAQKGKDGIEEPLIV